MTAVLSTTTRTRRPQGSITERNGNLIVRVFVGRDAQGKRVYWYHTVQGSDARAQSTARATLKQLLKQKETTAKQAVRESRLSFGEWTTEYVGTWCGHLTDRTTRNLRYAFTHYIPADLQAVPLRALTTARLQTWLNDLTASGKAPRTVAKVRAEVRRCLAVAVKQGRAAFNAATDVTPPKPKHVERVRLTGEQAAAFLKAAESDTLYAYFVLALTTGARPGELLALRWSDIEGDTLTIQRAVTIGANRERIVADTKTGKVRRMALGSLERSALARHKLRLGHVPAADAYIFAGRTGEPRESANVDHRHLKPLLTAAGLPSMRLVDLRHSCGSLLADQGVDPKVIQQRLGHANIQTTYNNYIHAHPDAQQRASDVLNRALGASVGGASGGA